MFNIFKLPSPVKVAREQLALAELELLKAETQVEFASALVTFNRDQINRLAAYIDDKTAKGEL